MFDQAADRRFIAIVRFLRVAEVGAACAFFMDLVVYAPAFQLRVARCTLIGDVGPQTLVPVLRPGQVGQVLRIMYGRRSDNLIGDQHRASIGAGMVLVPVKGLAALLRPPRVHVLLRKLAGLLRPPGRRLAGLDLGVLLPSIALTGHFHHARVHDHHGLRAHTFRRQLRGELIEQPLCNPGGGQRLPEAPHRGEVRNLVAEPQAQEAPERRPVGDLAIVLFVGQVEQALQDQTLEDQHHVVGLAASHRLRALRKHRRQLRTNQLRANIAAEFLQRIAQPHERGQSLGLNKYPLLT